MQGSGACPECNIPLRRTNFRLQLFEDANVDKEVDIRRRILKDFNKQEEDFDSLRGYNDYLEMVEDIIFNLTNNLDILETNKKIQQYKDENKDNIMKNRSRLSKDSQELLDILSMEEKFSKQVQLEMKVLEDAEKVAKIKNKEKLIDDLMFGEADANQILEQHREMVSAEERSKAMFSTGLDLEAGPAQGSGAAQAGGVVQDPLFEYQETLVDLMGPSLPRMEALEGDPGLNYLRHMRSVCQVSLCPHCLAHCLT